MGSPVRWQLASVTRSCVLFRPLPAVLAVAVIAATSGAARADAVKLSGAWIQGVDVQNIENGSVIYVTPTGSRASRPLSELGGLRIDEVPALEKANQALAEGNSAEAIEQYRAAADEAEPAWLVQFIRTRLLAVLQDADQPEAALELYLELAQGGTPGEMLPDPPAQWLLEADDQTKQRFVEPINNALNAAESDALRNPLSRLKQIVSAVGDEAGNNESAEVAAQGGLPVQMILKDHNIVLPKAISEVKDTAIVKHLKAGEFEAARKAANEALSDLGDTPRELYLRGVAELAMAHERGGGDSLDEPMLKEAGLSFMTVVIYYEHVGGPYIGPSMAGAAFVHKKIGRADKASELYNDATTYLDQQADPVYFKHVQEQMGQ